MKAVRLVSTVLLTLLVLACTVPQAKAACTATGFVRDSINLTAALINPKTTVSGDVDATGCNIGVYYGPSAKGFLNNASVHDANYYGVVNNGATATVENSTIYDIGETPFNGDQHGVAVYFAYESNAQGNISGNVIWNYQKGGIVVNVPLAKSIVTSNTVIGQGPVDFIAQNGIQLGYGAQGSVIGNLVVGNSYTGANLAASGGVILVGGDGYGGATEVGVTIQKNVVVGNDIGVWLSNLDINYNPVLTPTKDLVLSNTVCNNVKNNTTCNATSPVTSTVQHNKMWVSPHI